MENSCRKRRAIAVVARPKVEDYYIEPAVNEPQVAPPPRAPRKSGNPWTELWDNHIQRHAKEVKEWEENSVIRDRSTVSSDRLRDLSNNQGDKKRAAIQKILNNMGVIRSEDQVSFHEGNERV
jgi:hypothetical protein